jgi:anaerobic selenocysteine-containing dehydrogenase
MGGRRSSTMNVTRRSFLKFSGGATDFLLSSSLIKWVKITTMRGYMKARALVTNRFKTFRIFGEIHHEIGVRRHWGYKGIKTGHSANRLNPHVGDANTLIREYKAFLCKIEKA